MTTTREHHPGHDARPPGADPDPPTQARVAGAPARRSAAGTRATSIVVALLIIGVGVVAAQEALASFAIGGLRPEDGWLHQAAGRLGGSTIGDHAVALGAGALAVGVVLLVMAWHGGSRPVRLRPAPAVVLRARDVARLAAARAEDVDGVLSASATASTRSVVVRVTVTRTSQVVEEVTQAVRRRLGHLEPTPRLRVRATTGRGDAS